MKGDDYNPHSVIKDEEVIASVSVNITDMVWNGVSRHFIQLGTVDSYYNVLGFPNTYWI